MDVINCADFFVDQFRGINFGGLKFAYSMGGARNLKLGGPRGGKGQGTGGKGNRCDMIKF